MQFIEWAGWIAHVDKSHPLRHPPFPSCLRPACLARPSLPITAAPTAAHRAVLPMLPPLTLDCSGM